jgi:hypothetical protein
MKKKVRIYKAPDGKGKYVNKTSKFLSKAQMGGAPDPSMLAYPGAQPAEEQDQTNQIIQFIINDITSKVEKEKTLFKLINIMGLPMDAATQLYAVVAEKITEDIEREDDAAYEEETGQSRKKESPLTKDAVITQRPEEEDEDFDYDLYSTTGRDIVMEESNEPDILDEALDPLAEQRYGGITRTYQYGGTYENALPDTETYESLVEPMTGYDMISQMAWNSETEDEESPYYGNYANTTLDYSKLQNGGAYKRAKKKYVNSVMKLLKKQMGGDNGSDVNPNQGDPTGANFRDGKLKMFTNSLKNNAQMVAMQNQVEQQYDQMMQEGGTPMQDSGIQMPEQDVENPMHHLNLYSQATSGIFGNPMNETVKAQFGLNVGSYNESDIPRGFYGRTMRRFGNTPNLREVDVRKTGLFGTPKQYTAYFDPSPLQKLNNPITAEMYGYGSTSGRKVTTFPAKVVYKNAIIKDVNNASLKEVDENTPENKSTDQKEGDVPTQTTTQRTPRSSSSGSRSSATPVVTGVLDQWGRSSNDRWYGFDPNTKKFTIPASIDVSDTARFQPAYTNSPIPSHYYDNETGRYYKQYNDKFFEIVGPKTRDVNTESLEFQMAPGSEYLYGKTPYGQWAYLQDNAYQPVSGKSANIGNLQSGQTKSVRYATLDSKPGYYYRVRNDGAYVKFKGDPAKHTASKQPIATIKKGDKEFEYLKKNAKLSSTPLPAVSFTPSGNNIQDYNELLRKANLLPKEYGGAIDDPFSNPLEPLQKFVGGGYDPSIPDLTEDNIQYVNSKDISDPYFQRGGLIKSLVPANLVRSGSNDVVQRIYNPVTGQTYTQAPASAARQIAAIDVKKRGITGRPKKYTVYYGAPGSMPPRDNKEQDDSKKEVKIDAAASARQTALENAGYGQRTDVTGLKSKSKRAIKQGERQRDRELEKLYEEDPTNITFTKIDENAPFDRTASNNNAYYLPDLTETTAEEDFAAWGTPKDAMEQTNAYIFPEGESDDSGWGVPRDMVEDPISAPISTPAPIAKPATGKQTEEFCFGNSCFSLPDQQLIEGHLFLDTPDLLSSYAYDNNSDWYDKEKREFDLSKVDKETLKKALRSEKTYANISDESLDAYADAWLKYQQGNQDAYGKQTIQTLGKDPSALESFGFAEKYADFLNATGQTAEGKPYSIWDTTGPLKQTPEQVAARRTRTPFRGMQNGGGLRRFVGGGDQPFTGENPVAYNNNPAIEGAQGQINWNQMSSPGLVTQMNTDQTKSYGVDATYKGLQPYDNMERMEKMPTLSASAGLRGFAKGTDQLAGVNTPLAVDVKNKLTQGEREARLIAGNTLLRGIAGYKNRLDDTKQMQGFYDNFTADNLYASDPSRDRGDYAESGLYRPDEQGQTWYGRSAQMGGYIDDDFEDGEEVYMTDEEIKQYMANGGQIEFI